MNQVSRRAIAKGAAWAVPTFAVSVAAPAFASSQPPTGTRNKATFYFVEFNSHNSQCSAQRPQGGYINTQGTNIAGSPSPSDSDSRLDPNTSIGYWFETSNRTSGTVNVQQISTVYTFNKPIVVDQQPDGIYNKAGSTKWTQATVLNGWTYSLSADGKTLTLTNSNPTTVMNSTSTASSGTYVPGYFINYHFAATNPCPGTTATISSATTIKFADADYPNGTTFTKTTRAVSV